ncbi:UDP-glycosyltransferase superfamily protein, putative [Medicago truncatula]|uniref:UDP-glycosyltransferase superfamily protein, putative n=1 Tax=Medicago truncatula TaxID=3880 RepID=A0A072UFH1_MEDTR|nr:UDP-glycosyltransferase superfamily protein, putative [Medicago truncatula]
MENLKFSRKVFSNKYECGSRGNIAVERQVWRIQDIEELVKRFMNLESQEGKKIRDRAKEPKVVCCKAIGKGGFSDRNLDAFISDISYFILNVTDITGV